VFRILRQTDYSVRLMLTLALRPHGERVSTQQLQRETLVPLAFLQRLVASLRRAGLLLAYPGKNGGLQLARPATHITVLDIHEAIEGPVDLSDCVRDPATCPLSEPCPVRPRWGRLEAVIVKELRATTLAQLARERVANGERAAARPVPLRTRKASGPGREVKP
jgi:Rrf2 family protein